jgi:hypothetical protein
MPVNEPPALSFSIFHLLFHLIEQLGLVHDVRLHVLVKAFMAAAVFYEGVDREVAQWSWRRGGREGD